MVREPVALEVVLSELCQREAELRARGIEHAAVFGSVARRENRADSDIDILVEVRRGMGFGTLGLMVLEEELQAAFGRSVDVMSSDGLKLPKHAGIVRDLVRAF
jgi:predicted nucleotidyltransferase